MSLLNKQRKFQWTKWPPKAIKSKPRTLHKMWRELGAQVIYIPDDTSNDYIFDHPNGETVVSDPLRIACYATDGRGPSSEEESSSRIHAQVTIGLIAEDPYVEEKDRSLQVGETTEYGCATEVIECQETTDFDEAKIDTSRNGNLFRVSFDLAAGNPCNLFADSFGAIDVEIVLTINLLTRSFEFEGTIDEFPNYEMFIQYDDEEPVEVFSYEIETDASPISLLGEADKSISGSGFLD